jgi:hypothetical protein
VGSDLRTAVAAAPAGKTFGVNRHPRGTVHPHDKRLTAAVRSPRNSHDHYHCAAWAETAPVLADDRAVPLPLLCTRVSRAPVTRGTGSPAQTPALRVARASSPRRSATSAQPGSRVTSRSLSIRPAGVNRALASTWDPAARSATYPGCRRAGARPPRLGEGGAGSMPGVDAAVRLAPVQLLCPSAESRQRGGVTRR